MPTFNKITSGFVIQEYNEDGLPIFQEFVAGDDVTYENRFGEPVDAPADVTYCPYEMVQPVNLLQEPLTAAQLRHDPVIDVVIAVPTEVVINSDFEGLMDYFEEQILENAILSDISYDMVGSNSATDLIYFRIEAVADLT